MARYVRGSETSDSFRLRIPPLIPQKCITQGHYQPQEVVSNVYGKDQNIWVGGKQSQALKTVGSNRLPQEFLTISTNVFDKKSVVEVELWIHACGRGWLRSLQVCKGESCILRKLRAHACIDEAGLISTGYTENARLMLLVIACLHGTLVD